MVTRSKNSGRRGALATECIIALGLIALAVFPLSFAFLHEARYSRACYHRAAAMGVVDGEMEILAAGEWQSFPVGTQDYPVKAPAATNLPPGRFILTIEKLEKTRLRLEWRPAGGKSGGPLLRERNLP